MSQTLLLVDFENVHRADTSLLDDSYRNVGRSGLRASISALISAEDRTFKRTFFSARAAHSVWLKSDSLGIAP